jgi:hypothetical protein
MGIEFFRGEDQSLEKNREIHDDLLCGFVKPLRFGEGYSNLSVGGGKISTWANFGDR